MNMTDITSGRIIQRVFDKVLNADSPNICVVHGIDDSLDIKRLTDNLFTYFPSCEITLKMLKYGYELKIEFQVVE